jgi:hypothetical protein
MCSAYKAQCVFHSPFSFTFSANIAACPDVVSCFFLKNTGLSEKKTVQIFTAPILIDRRTDIKTAA